MTPSENLIFYIDGASQGNPGPAGIGVVVCDNKGNVIDNISEYLGENTNNVAEYSALIIALEEGLIKKASSITINTDSELLVKQLNGEYKVKNEGLKQLFHRVQRLLKGFRQVQINHIGRPQNKGADKLATKAVDGNKKIKASNSQASFFLKIKNNGFKRQPPPLFRFASQKRNKTVGEESPDSISATEKSADPPTY